MRIRKRSAFLSSLTSDLSQRREANEEHKNEELEKGGERGGGGGGRVQHKTHLSDQRDIKAAPPSHLHPSKGDLPTIPLQGFQQLPAGNGCQKPTDDDRELETHRHPEQDEGEQEDEENNMKEVGAKETRSNRGARGEYPSLASRRWCKGETVFPLKKRKAIDYRDGSEGDNSNDNRNSTTDIHNGSGHHSEAAENKWKCSRMNGRGWRCSKPTLVGYSLCEHHLGKGRRIKTINTLLHGKQASKERTRKKGQGKGGDGGDDATAGSRSMNSLISQKISSDHSDGINMDIMN